MQVEQQHGVAYFRNCAAYNENLDQKCVEYVNKLRYKFEKLRYNFGADAAPSQSPGLQTQSSRCAEDIIFAPDYVSL